MKFTRTDYGNNIEILKYDVQEYIAKPIMVSANGIVEDADGKKIVKSGSSLSGVDVTYGNAPGSLVKFGFI